MNGLGTRVRGCALAVLCALATATGHAAAGGALPDLALLLVLLPLLCGVFVTLADRATGPVGLLAVLGGGQFALHQLMELLHPAHSTGPAVLGAAGMLLVHGIVTAVTAVAVRHADAAVAAVAAALARVLPRPPVLPAADRPLPAAVPAAPAAGLRLAGALSAVHVRRGPPVRV